MAALSEPTRTLVNPSLCSVEAGKDNDMVIISNERSFVDIFKLSDQKLLSSQPVSVGITISSAVWSKKKQQYFLLQNKQVVCSWDEDYNEVKKMFIPTNVHKLFSLDSYEPVVLCENGAVGFLGEAKTLCDSPVLTEGQIVNWCSALKLRSGICVLYTSSKDSNRENICLHSCWYSSLEGRWKHTAVPLESHGLLLSCACCLGPSQDDVRLLTLWKEGSLYEMLLSETSLTQRGQPLVVKGLLEPCSLFCLSDSAVAIVGLQEEKQYGIGILDTKFGTIQAWQPYTGKLTDRKAFCLQDHIVLHSGNMLHVYRYECQVSTLAGMMGKKCGSVTDVIDKECGLPVTKRRKTDKTLDDQTADEFHKVLHNLADPVKTSSYTSFKREFALLKSKLPQSSMSDYQSGLSLVVKRCCSEKTFWPAMELEFLILNHCVSPRDIGMVFGALCTREEVNILYKALQDWTDLPEESLVQALHCFLSAPKEVLAKVEADVTMTDAADKSFLFFDPRTACVDSVLSKPFDEVFLLKSLKKLPFALVLEFLRYILHKMKSNTEDLDLLSKWKGVTIDAHATQLVMSKDAHEVLVKFQEEEEMNSQFVDSAKELLPYLKLAMTETAKQSKSVGQYCIEVLRLM